MKPIHPESNNFPVGDITIGALKLPVYGLLSVFGFFTLFLLLYVDRVVPRIYNNLFCPPSFAWSSHTVESIRKTELGKSIYAKRKETIERVFADAKEKHAMRYTHMRGLAQVTQCVKLKFAAMNLKKLAKWAWHNPFCEPFFHFFFFDMCLLSLSPA